MSGRRHRHGQQLRDMRLRSSIQRALDRCVRQIKVNLIERLDGVGVDHDQMVALQGTAEVYELVDAARNAAVQLFTAYARDEGQEGQDARDVMGLLTRCADNGDGPLMRSVMDQMALMGILEGVVLGVAHAYESGQAARVRNASRPGR